MTPEEARVLFPLAEKQVWMRHSGGSPTPLPVRDAICRVAHAMTESMDWPEQYYADRNALREVLGRLINADASNIAFTRATAHGLSLVASGLDWRAGDNVVGARMEYPTNLFPWMALERHDVELRLVEPVEGRITPDAVFEAMDERTRVVSLSFVQFWNGYRLDVAAIGAECRRRGVTFVVDGIQGVGAVRIDVEAANIDVLAAGAIKWLMGPAGIGFCFVHPATAERLTPPLVGMGSMKDPNPFAPELAWADGAKRFEESATSWLDIAGFLGAVGLLEDVGFDVVEDRVLAHSRRLAEGLDRLGLTVAAPWPRTRAESSGIIAFHAPDGDPVPVARCLDAAGILSHPQQALVRMSPHFYNTDDEMDRVLEALSGL
ncbi:MAG: aminotransferase class V-fold PLP-dependent enzyme [Actinobacteria bacterium]|nr:aminotransferase class V-fold PLP-dependent enzyme [Actinomycetota bacterium]